jgi:hypothetical protein
VQYAGPGFEFGPLPNIFKNNYIVSGTGTQLFTKQEAIFNYEKCPPGTFTSSLKQLALNDDFTGCPFLCKSGKYASDDSVRYDECKLTCGKGSYCPPGSATPISCPPGRFGTTTSESLAASCKLCPSGYWSDTPPAGETGVSYCIECPRGWQQNDGGKAFCFACLPGQAQPNKTQTSCDTCDAGFYQVSETLYIPIDFSPFLLPLTYFALFTISCDAGRGWEPYVQELPSRLGSK